MARRSVTYQFPTWSPDGTRIAAIATTPTGNAVHAFAVPKPGVGGSSSAVPTAIDPTTVYEAAAGRTVLRLLGAEQHDPHVPDHRTRRHRAADSDRPTARSRCASCARRCRSTGPGRTSDRMLVHSGGDAPGAFLGEVSRDGSTAADLGVQPGDFRAPARSRDGRYRGYIVPATDAPEHVVVEGSDGSGRHEVPVLGGGVVGFGPDGDELAFIAPAKAGPPVTVPIGPLRVVDAGSGDGADPAAGQRRGLLLVAQRTDDRRVPDRGTGRHGRAGAQHPAGRGGTGSRPRPGVRRRGLGLGPVANAGRLADTFTAQVLPFFDQYALSHRLWAPDSSAIVVPLVADDATTGLVDHPAGRLRGAADRRRRHRLLEPLRLARPAVQTSCAHYLCK